MSDEDVDRGVRRIVGLAALRRLRRMVDADRAVESEKAGAARALTWLLLLAAAAALAWIAALA